MALFHFPRQMGLETASDEFLIVVGNTPLRVQKSVYFGAEGHISNYSGLTKGARAKRMKALHSSWRISLETHVERTSNCSRRPSIGGPVQYKGLLFQLKQPDRRSYGDTNGTSGIVE